MWEEFIGILSFFEGNEAQLKIIHYNKMIAAKLWNLKNEQNI